MTTPSAPRIIVGAVIIADGRVLAGERCGPPDLAGCWEFPGGLVEPGETEPQALARECLEERGVTGVTVDIGARIGPDTPIRPGRSLLRAYTAALAGHSQPSHFSTGSCDG